MEPAPSAAALPSSRSAFYSLYERLDRWKASLGLPNPGTVENLQREVKNVHMTHLFFDGARADLAKTLSNVPGFQVTHSFHLASPTTVPSYNFGAVFAEEEKHFLQGNVDHDGNVHARMNKYWSPANISKMQAQLSQRDGHNMIQLEHDYMGRDFSLNARAVNPSPTDLSGIYMGSFFHSLTQNLAVGAETLMQRQGPLATDRTTSWILKYTSSPRDWIATAQLQVDNVFMASYWQRLNEKVEVAADLQVIAGRNAQRRSGLATLGAKWELRMASFRAQVDSTLKVSALLEQRFAPSFAFQFCGEIDHLKNQAKIGVGVMIDSAAMPPEEAGAYPYPA